MPHGAAAEGSGLAGVLLAHAARPSDDLVDVATRERVLAERDRVERWLAAGGSAYGFTTLFGHLGDSGTEPAVGRRESGEAELLRSHLIAGSRTVELGPLASRCVLGAKVLQLSHGGSGISGSTFDAFVARSSGSASLRLPLLASYSCGDVVPGAWVLAGAVPRHEDLRTGDVIAGISGSHVSTGIGVVALALAVDAVDSGLTRLSGVRPHGLEPTRIQPPVSLRAGESLTRLLDEAVTRCSRALDGRLARPAANPLLVPVGADGIEARSTSAFLGLELADALMSLRSSLLVLAQHVVSLHVQVERVRGSRASLTLQFPKVLHAFQSRLVQRYGGTAPYLRPVEGGSDGLEDVADHSLHLALDVVELSLGVHALLELGADHLAALTGAGSVPTARGEHIAPDVVRLDAADGDSLRTDARHWSSPALG